MIPFSEAEKPKLLDMQKLRMDQLWRKKQIGDATYLRSLFIMGKLPDEARSYLNMLKMEK